MIFCSPAPAHLFRFGAQQATGTPLRDERMAACCAIRIQAYAVRDLGHLFHNAIMAAVAQAERRMISERTKAALQAAKARGACCQSPKLRCCRGCTVSS